MLARALGPLALTLVTGGCQAAPDNTAAPNTLVASRPMLGLMTTLPIFWGEANDVGELVQSKASAGWVREALEGDFVLKPLDTLNGPGLAGFARLVLAQPRPLTAAENVALDDWVRKGGQLLLFADPMLTGHSRYSIGDRRRPQDVVLLSPILSHWGLDLTFDEDQREGEHRVAVKGIAMPVNLPGALRSRPGGGCAIAADGVIAECRLGSGKVTIVADAALLEDSGDAAGADRGAALAHLLRFAFS